MLRARMSGCVKPLPVVLPQLTFPYTASSECLFTHINNNSEQYSFTTDLTVTGEYEVACNTRFCYCGYSYWEDII
jgi:hypothetical protein